MRFFRATLSVWIAFAVGLPALILRLAGVHLSPVVASLLFGSAIVAAAYILSVACEVAQMDMSRALAIALLAILAVLPEYAVDFYFTWNAPHVPEYTHYAVANMTGANRLLIGFGWAFLMFIYWFKTKKKAITLARTYGIELSFLALATIYSFLIPLKGRLDLVDTLILVSLFVLYMYQAAKSHQVEPDLEGAAAAAGALDRMPRRLFTAVSFLFAGGVILASTEPFAESLLDIGKSFGIDEFLLVQWIAPLASESPEIIVATIFALKMNPGEGFGALVSSKVNQWTLLIGTLPLVYSVSAGRVGALHFDARQTEELALTAAQSIFAVALLADYNIKLWEAGVLFVLFVGQLIVPTTEVRWAFTVGYVILTVLLLIFNRERRDGLFKLSVSPIQRMRNK